jgi:hypothetical protein
MVRGDRVGAMAKLNWALRTALDANHPVLGAMTLECVTVAHALNGLGTMAAATRASAAHLYQLYGAFARVKTLATSEGSEALLSSAARGVQPAIRRYSQTSTEERRQSAAAAPSQLKHNSFDISPKSTDTGDAMNSFEFVVGCRSV